mgnify:CR=1 FL=1|tara:strand:+ start:138 stop:428 length:291 start_codon:yes stop_codon:yes gene_type:complete
MRIQMQVWNDEKQIHEIKFVNQQEVKPKKKARYRGKNKISNFKDKVEQRKKDAQLYKRGTVWAKSQQAEQMHAMRQCHSTETRYLYLERTGQLDTI